MYDSYMAKTGNRKRFNENNNIRSIFTPGNGSESIITGGLNDFFLENTKVRKKEEGISNVLGAIVGNSNVNNFDNLKSAISIENTIFAKDFGKNVLDIFKSIDSRLENTNLLISTISTLLNDLIELNAIGLTSSINRENRVINPERNTVSENIITIILEGNNIETLDNLIDSLKEFPSNIDVANLEAISSLEKIFEKLNELTDKDGIANQTIKNISYIGNRLKKIVDLNIKENTETIKKSIVDLNELFKKDISDLFNNVYKKGNDSNKLIASISNVNKFFVEASKLTDKDGIIVEAIENINNIPPISKTGQKNIRALISLFTSISNFTAIDTRAFKHSVKELQSVFISIDKVFDTIEKIDISDNIDLIKEKLEKIRKLYSDDIAITAKTISEHNNDLDVIKSTSERTTEVATSASKIDNKEIEQSISNISDIIDSITMMSLMMLLGGYIISKHHELIKASLVFGATLSLFLMELMIPMSLISLIVARKETKANLSDLLGLIVGLSIIMVIGAFIVNAKDIVEPALKFGLVLTAFLTMLMIPISLMSLVSGKETFENINKINAVVVMSALLMIIGSFVINYIDVKAALKFGVVLGLFIAAVLVPFMIYGLFVKKATDVSDSILGLVITCTIIMMIGALFVQIPTFVHNALMFGVVLGAFILLTLTPILAFALLQAHVAKTIKTVLWYIVTCTLIMMIGAMLMNNTMFIHNALAFGFLLMAFMTLTLLPVLMFSLFAKKLMITLVQVVAFMTICTFIMMVGALFVADKRLVLGSIAFGLLLGLFMTAMLAPFLLLTGPLILAEKQLVEMAIFIIACGLILALTTYIVDKYGWKALYAVGIIDAFVLSVLGIIRLITIGLKKTEVVNANLLMQGVSLLLITITASLLLMNFVKPGSIVKFGIIEAAVFGFIFVTQAIIRGLKKTDVVNANLLMQGIGLLLLAVTASLLLMNFVKEESIIKFVILNVCIGLMIYFVKEISEKLKKSQVTNALSIMLGISALILASTISLLLLNFVKPDSLIKLALLELCIAGMLALVKLVNKISSKKDVEMAVGTMLAISGMLLISTMSLLVLNFVKDDSIKKLALLELCIVGMLTIVSIISYLIDEEQALTACLVMTLISTALIIASGALLILNFVKDDSIKKLALLELCIGGMLGIVYLAGLIPLPAIEAGILAIGMIEVLLLGLGVVMLIMVSAIKLAESVKNPDAIKIVFASFINVVESIPINPIKLALLVAKGAMISMLVMAIAPALLLVGLTVSNLANLRVATAWNEHGKPTAYRQLNHSDFKNAAINISTLITTLSSGILMASKDLKKINTKTLLKTLYFSEELGTVIGSIAEGVKSYAQLMIPDRWNDNGKPISYHLMRSDEFTDASNNISKIILTVGGAIARIASGKGEITLADGTKFSASDYMKVLEGDNWWQGKSDFTKVLNASSKLGELISNIATGVGAFAKLMIPIRWNDDGKPISFRQLSENDINLAIKNIGSIITATAQPIMNLATDPEYFGLFDTVIQSTGFLGMTKKESDSKFMKVLNGSAQLGQVIANLANGVQSMANLRFITKYDTNGNPVEWITIGNEDFKVVSSNVQKILTASIEGIKAAMPFMPEPEKLKEIVDAVTPIGNIIANTATGIGNMAELKIATEFDENGKAIKWRQMGEQDFSNAATNISKIITITAQALLNAYAKYEEKYDTETMKKVFEGMKPVSDIISSIANSIVNLACGKVTINGKDHIIDSTDINRAKENIDSLLNATVDTIINVVNKYPAYFEDNHILSDIVNQLNDVITLVGGISDSIIKFVDIQNIDNALSNISKLLNNETGIISTTLAGFEGITQENVNMLPIYTGFIDNIIPLFSSLMKYSDEILKNKNILDNIVAYANNMSAHGNAGIFSDIDFLIHSILLENMNDIESVTNGTKYLVSFNMYLLTYKNILEYIINSVYPLFDEIERIYERYFAAENSIATKINTIVNGIRSTISVISPIETKKTNFFDLFKKSDKRKILDGLNNFREQISIYVEILNLINKIPNISINNDKLDTESLSALFDRRTKGNSIYSVLYTFTSLNDISSRDLNNAMKRMNSFNDIVIKLIEVSSHANAEFSPDVFTSINESISKINEGVNKSSEVNNKALENFNRETNTLDKFVQAVDKVNVGKITKLTDLMSTMSELASKMGGFNELIKLIDGDLVNVLDKLTEKIEDAKKTISNAERIEAERQRKFQSNLKELNDLVKNPISVKVGGLNENDTITAGWEKTKR